MRNYFSIFIVTCIVVASLSLGLYAFNNLNKRDLSKFNGTLLTNPREISNFELLGIDDKPFTNATLQGRWTFIFFGFTNCKSMCPTIMSQLNEMYSFLSDKKIRPLPNVVMISLDPKRDRENLYKYVKAFNKDFYGAYEDLSHIKVLTRELGVMYLKVAGKDGESYDIEHTGTVLLFNPKGQLNAFFTWPLKAKDMANDYKILVS